MMTSKGRLLLRPTAASDADQFRALRLEALRQHPEVYASDYDSSLQLAPAHWLDRVEQGAGTERALTMVAEHETGLVGMTAIFRELGPKIRHQATLVSVYVQPAWRGMGLVGHLIAGCLQWAREQQVRQVVLAVVTTNSTAIRSYARAGFVVYGLLPAAIVHNGVDYDELLMIKHLGR